VLFHSWVYIFFLITTVLLYWNLPARFRIPLILLASYVFYMSWSPPFGLIYGPLIFLDTLYFYALSKAMVRWPEFKKPILIFGITTELMILAYFKYANFLLDTLNNFLGMMHSPQLDIHLTLFLPLAISFTNFILISYLVDVYRGKETPDPSFTRFAAYVVFFPHLIAGPIVRASELLHQFDQKPKFSIDQTVQGIHKFMFGLGLKLLVADVIAVYVNPAFAEPGVQTFVSSWIAAYGFSVQIFSDFLSYTLMAQGSALLMGFTLPDNFNSPYLAKNITDFWRRWHMSLSRWLRDYLYIPLGGSHCSRWKAYRNLFMTMGLGGLWHGANWTFVVWGLYHGLLLSLHKLAVYTRINRFVPSILAVFLTFNLVTLGWVVFRAKNFTDAATLLHTMFSPNLKFTFTEEFAYALMVMMMFAAIQFSLWLLPRYQLRPAYNIVLQSAGYFVLFYMLITTYKTTSEFIYFQF